MEVEGNLPRAFGLRVKHPSHYTTLSLTFFYDPPLPSKVTPLVGFLGQEVPSMPYLQLPPPPPVKQEEWAACMDVPSMHSSLSFIEGGGRETHTHTNPHTTIHIHGKCAHTDIHTHQLQLQNDKHVICTHTHTHPRQVHN